jgi:hypothetical protein
MARTLIALQDTTRDGLDATYDAADGTDGNSFDNDSQAVFLHVKNGGGSPITVTIDVAPINDIDGITIPGKDVSIPAGEDRFIGPFPRSVYSQEDVDNTIDQAVFVDYSDDTSVTVAAIQLGSISI